MEGICGERDWSSRRRRRKECLWGSVGGIGKGRNDEGWFNVDK